MILKFNCSERIFQLLKKMSEQRNIKVDHCTVLFTPNKQDKNSTESALKSSSFVYGEAECHIQINCGWSGKIMAYIKSDPILPGNLYAMVTLIKGNNVITYPELKILDTKNSFWSGSLSEISAQMRGADKWNFIFKFQFRAESKYEQNQMITGAQTSPCLNENHSLRILSDDFGNTLKDESTHNVQLKIGEDYLPANKDILKARSLFFRSKLGPKTNVVDIPNVNGAAVREIVNYTYTGKYPVNLSFELAKEIYKARDMCDVGNLREFCKNFLLENLSQENACQCLAIADDDEFKDKCIMYIMQNEIPFKDEFWKPFCKDHSELAVCVLNILLRKSHSRST